VLIDVDGQTVPLKAFHRSNPTRKEVNSMDEATATEVQVEVGDAVVYHDPKGRPHNALVTCVHNRAPYYCVNLVLVSPHESERDQYGRQIERVTSLYHGSHAVVYGQYWRRPDEAPNPYTEPASV
jgi:hypothetical protein